MIERRNFLKGAAASTLMASAACSRIGDLIRTFQGHTGAVYSVAIAPDGRTALSGSEDKTLKLWDLSSGREIRTFRGHNDRVTSVVVSAPTGGASPALSGSIDKNLKLWDLSNGNEKLTLQDTDRVWSVMFFGGADALSGSEDTTLKQWYFSTGSQGWVFHGHTGPVRSVVMTPDGLAALSGSEDKTLKRWDILKRR